MAYGIAIRSPLRLSGVWRRVSLVGWAIPIFFQIRFKIKWLEKECIFQNFDQNKVHFNQNLGSKSSRFQSKASAAADLARRAWLRRTRDDGGTTIRFRIFRRRGGGTGVTSREGGYDSGDAARGRRGTHMLRGTGSRDQCVHERKQYFEF